MPAQPTKETLVNATLATTISPTGLTADQNDYDPTGFGTADEVRLSTDASRTITGFAAPTGTEQTRKTVINVGSNDLVLAHEDVLSLAANRLVTADAANLTLTAGQAANIAYDTTTTRWRVLSSPGGGGGSAQTEWTVFTPVLRATTTDPTPGLLEAYWRREGDSMRIRYWFEYTASNQAGSGTYHIDLPVGYSLDASKLVDPSETAPVLGYGFIWDSSNPTDPPTPLWPAYAESIPGIYFLVFGQPAGLSNSGPITPTTGDWIQFEILVPIEGWAAGGGESGGGGVTESTISPTALSADADDYAPTDWQTATIVRLSTDGSDYDITGFAAPTGDVIRKTLINVGGTGTITLKNEDTNSTAANRTITSPGSGFAMLPNDAVELLYDEVSTRWRTV